MRGFEPFVGILIVAAIPALVFGQQGAGNAIPSNEDILRRLTALEMQMQKVQRLPPVPGPSDVGSGHGRRGACPTANCFSQTQEASPCECGGSGYANCECNTKPQFPSVYVTGFFHLDGVFVDQDAANRGTVSDIEDGLAFRRTRLAAAGKVARDTSFILEFDFAQSQARFVDVWMQFDETSVGNIRIGRYRQPLGMTELTSARDIPFLERPTAVALAPFRQTGVMLFDALLEDRMTYAVSGYRYLSDNFGNVFADTGGYGMAMRLTMLPVDLGDDRLMHVGFAYSHNDPGRGLVPFVSTNEVFVGQQPSLGLAGLSVLPIVGTPPFVDTGPMPTAHTNIFNVEGAVSLGRLVLQSEARLAQVEMTSGITNTFPAAYGHLRYMLTGETLPYNRKAGNFARIKPRSPVDFACGEWGAWEVAARVSYIDLNGTGIPGPGRRLTNLTVGVNWYLNNFTKLQMNWIASDLVDPTQGDSSAQTVALRGQLDF